MIFEPILTRQHYFTCLVISLSVLLVFIDVAQFWYLSEILLPLFFGYASNESTPWLALFAKYVAGPIAMPLGALLFGTIGDRHGRKVTLRISCLGVAILTLLIGTLPTRSVLSDAAPIVLTSLRFFQGLFAGVMLPTCLVFITEHFPTKRLGIGSSIISSSAISGLLIVSIYLNTLINTLTIAEIMSYGWRILYCISGTVTLMLFFAIGQLKETPVFQRHHQPTAPPTFDDAAINAISLNDSISDNLNIETKNRVDSQTVPICQKLGRQLRIFGFSFLPNTMPSLILSVIIASLIIFIPILLLPLIEIGFFVSPVVSRFGGMIGMLFMMIGCVFFGVMADLHNIGRVLMIGSTFLIVNAVFFVYHLQSGGGFILVFFALLGFFSGLIGAIPSVIVRLFPTKIRLKGVTLSYALSYAALAITLPIAIHYLSLYIAFVPVLYVMFIGLVTLFVSFYVYYLPRTQADINR